MRLDSFAAYEAAYAESVNNPEKFWGDIANTFHWKQPFTKVCEWDFATPEVVLRNLTKVLNI